MTTFDILLEDRGIPGWGTALVFIGLALLLALCITASVKLGNVEPDGFWRVLFTCFCFFLAPLIVLSPGVVNGYGVGVRDTQLVSALEELGYENVDLEQSDSFVASEDGRYIRGDILEKSYTEYVVVIRTGP